MAHVEGVILLSGILESSELTSLDHEVAKKLEKHLVASENHMTKVKEEMLVLQTTSSQECEELQKLLSEKENVLIQELTSSEKLRNDLQETESKCKELSNQLLTLENSSNKIQLQLEKAEYANKDLAEEKTKFLSILEEKNKDNSRLNEEIKSLSEQLVTTNKNKCDMLIRAEELQSKELTLQYQEKRLQQELEFANQQVSLLNNQIVEKNQQILNANSEKMNQILQLQNQLDSKSDQVKLHEEKLSNSNLTVDSLENIVEKKNSEIEELQKTHVQMEMDYQREVKAQKKLSDLYKKSSEEHLSKVSELMKAVDELQTFIEKSTQEHEALEKKYNENIDEHEEFKKETRQKIEKLEIELRNANTLLTSSDKSTAESTVEQLYPEAAVTNKLLKSGKSLTSLYTDYANVQQELLEQRQNNERLKEYLENVLQEVEEKTPFLAQQKNDYEKALSTITALNVKLDCAINDREEALKERDYQSREAKAIGRENNRLKVELMDLSSQVRLLLKEVELCRGNYVADDDQQVSSSDESSSSRLISKRLVTFRNIEELQKQNSQLLAVVRELSEGQELKEKNSVDERTSQLMSDLEIVKNQLEELTAARSRQETILESVIRQRDMYRVLLSENGNKIEESPTLSRSPKVKSSEVSDLTMIINQMKSEEKRFKEESSENMRILTEQLDTVRNKSFEIKLENGRLTSQSEISTERINVLQLRLDGAKKEVEIFHEKNAKLSNTVAKHEETVTSLKRELLSAQADLSRVEVSYENLKNEFNLMRNREEILVHEKESLTKERRTQGEVLANLQSLQANLEQVEAERKLNMQTQLDKLLKENEVLRKKTEGSADDYKNAVQLWEKKLDEMREKLEKQMEDTRKMEAEHTSLKNKIKELQNEATSNEPKPPAVNLPVISTPSKTEEQNQASVRAQQMLKESLNKVELHNKELSAELKLKNDNLKSLQNLTSELENRLKETVETSAKVQKELENKISSSSEGLKRIEDEKHNLNLKNQELFNEVQDLIQQNKSSNESTLNELRQVKIQLQNSKESLINAEKNMNNARLDARKQAEAASQADQKYKHELMLHANDIKENAHVKTELEKCKQVIAAAQQAEQLAKNQLEKLTASWQLQEQILKKNSDEANEKALEIQNQNKILHDQIQLMNTQIMALKNSNLSSSSLDVSITDDEAKGSEQLLQVIKYLRNEKEIQSAHYDSEKAENIRLQSQKQHAENRIGSLEHQILTLKKQAESSQANVSLAAKHNELMKKVEMMNMLEDSNALLRQEKENLAKLSTEQKAQIEEIQNVISTHEGKINVAVADKESAVAENNALRVELKRWQARVKQLTEQTNKFTPADLRRLNEELDDLRKKCQALTTETNDKKTEISRLVNECASAKTEVESLRQKCELDKKEIQDLKEHIQSRPAEKELIEKKKLIVQVKNIAKKYKELYSSEQQKTAELESKAKLTEKTLIDSQESQKQKDEKIKEIENERAQINNKVAELTNEITELKKKNEESVNNLEANILQKTAENQKLQEKITELSEELSKTKVEADKIVTRVKAITTKSNATVSQLKAEKETLMSEVEEYKLRLSTLQSQYEGTISRLEKEVETSKQNQTPNEELNESLLQAQKQITELTAKLAQQKQLSQQQQVTKPSTSAGPVVTTVSSETRTANIKPMSTPTSSAARHIPPQRETGSSPSVTNTRTHTPTASVKPMAIGSTTSAPVCRTATVMPTTTVVSAAVLPQTSEIIHEDHQVQASSLSPSSHMPVRQVTVTPTALHQSTPVSLPQQAPTVAVLPSIQEPAVPVVEGTTFTDDIQLQTPVSAPMVVVSPHVDISRPEVTGTHEDLAGPSTAGPPTTSSPTAGQPTTGLPTTGLPTTGLPTTGIPITGPSTTGSRIKRQREDIEIESAKRIKQQVVAVAEVASQSQRIAPVVIVPSVTFATEEPPADITEIVRSEEPVPEPIQESHEVEPYSEENVVVGEVEDDVDDDDDVIVVESDDDDDEEEEEEEEGESGAPEDEEVTEESESDGADEGMEDDQLQYVSSAADMQEYEEEDDMNDEDEEEDEEDDENYEADELAEPSNNDDDNDIEIIDQDEPQLESGHEQGSPEAISSDAVPTDSSSHDATAAHQEAVAPASVTSQATIQVIQADHPNTNTIRGNVVVRSERLPSFGRQQLTPFIVGQGQGYEEGDDSIVPSTPTLIVPRRTDGFAEAVSSPQVPQGRFVFSNQNQDPNTSSASSVSLASQGALGVDDTRMDLLQFDDGTTGTGRSVPTTPLQVSSPGEESISEDRVPSQPIIAAANASTTSQPSCFEGGPTETSLSLDDQTGSNKAANVTYSFREGSSQVSEVQPVPVPSTTTVSSEAFVRAEVISIDSAPDSAAVIVTSVPMMSVQSTSSTSPAPVSSVATEYNQESATQAEAMDLATKVTPTALVEADQAEQSKQMRKPIVWEDPNRAQPNPSSQTVGSARGQRGAAAATRARRIRIRGGATTRARFGRGRAGRGRAT